MGTEIIKLPRGFGKTTKAIEYAKENNLPLLVANERFKKELKRVEPSLDVLTVADLKRGKKPTPFVVDNLDIIFNDLILDDKSKANFIEWLTGIKIELATVNDVD